MDWEECYKKRIVKEIKKDFELIKSLIKTSNNKLISESELVMNDVNANSKISLVYDSLRELLEALSIKNDYKIYNHECYVPFLKEILRENEIAEEFDDVRKIRNQINYYGKEVSILDCKNIINRIKELRNRILILLEN